MQLVTRATSIAAVAVVFTSMLMQISAAVEVTGGSSPLAMPAASGPAATGPVREDELAPPPSSPNCFILGSRSFSIPFSVDASGAQPVEVHLFVSRGPNDEWKLLDRKPPNIPQKQFQFEADGDGEFWFATRTVDARGQSHPEGAIQSQLKVYVDTTKPRVTFQADADADGRVDVTLSIHDATKLKDIKLRYVTDNLKHWVDVDLGHLSTDRKLQFQPTDSWKQLSIQLVVTDTPGNQSVVNQLLRRPRLAEADTSRFAVAPGRSSTDAMTLPYRIDPDDSILARPVSDPIIKLDRHQPHPAFNVTTAHGYAPEPQAQGNTPFYGFRGAQTPMPTRPLPASPSPMAAASGTPTAGMTHVPPPQLAPAPSLFPGTVPHVGMQGGAGQPVPTQPATAQLDTAQRATAQMGTAQPGAAQPVPTPQGLLDVLFGSSQQGSYPAQSTPMPAPAPSQLGFGPPSIRGTQVRSRLAGNVDQGLPAPATPEQISNGFDLNSPTQIQPETIPVPGNPEPSPAPQRPRPKTPAEAMRPITEPSEVSSLAQEEVPTPQGEPDPYQSMRATPGPATPPPPSSSVVDMMERAPVRYSDSQRFSLAYELEAVGVQGAEAIELYGSTDGGRTWDLWGRDPDRTSPFDIETKEAGVFGFRIVVVGRNGLASPRPLSGESPDIVVVVDNERPLVRITGAQYGEGDRIGSLIIRYECQDANLKQRPIALSFSDSVNGPWTTIAAGLRNDGEYIWNADPNLPRQLFLRIDATDEAGNNGTYVLDQPIDAQGLAPRARIRGFQTITGANLGTSEGQTAKRPRALFK